MSFKIIILTLFFLISVTLTFIFLQGKGKKSKAMKLPKIIAHKAYYKNYPANSLPAIQAIIDRQAENKIQAVEIDILHLKDGNIILFHDDELSPLTNGFGNPREKNYQEIKKLRIMTQGIETQTSLAKLDQIFNIVGGKLTYILDCKEPYYNSSFAKDLIKLIKNYPELHNKIIIASFNPIFLYHIQRLAPRIATMYSFETNSIAFEEEKTNNIIPPHPIMHKRFTHHFVKALINPDYLNVRYTISKDYRQQLLREKRPIVFWTIDDAQMANAFLAEGITSIISNRAATLSSQIAA